MYYRGCWHIVGRSLFKRYCQLQVITYLKHSSLIKELYNPKTFIVHAPLLGQAFAHCRKFPTAASRRSLGRVSVPMWLFYLSVQLRIIDLVGRYLTNYLMRRKAIQACTPKGALNVRTCVPTYYPVLAVVSNRYPRRQGRFLTCYSPICHSSRSSRTTCMY